VKHVKEGKKKRDDEDCNTDGEEEQHDGEEEKRDGDEHRSSMEVMDRADNVENEMSPHTKTAVMDGYPPSYELENLEVKVRLIRKTTIMRWYANSVCYDWLCTCNFFFEHL
jgi:hypothetical protein